MGVLATVTVAALGVVSLVIILAKFTAAVTMWHLVVAGFGIGLIFILAVIYVVWPASMGDTSRGRGKERYDRLPDVVSRINTLLNESEEWSGVEINPNVTNSKRREFVDKKEREFYPYWSVLTEIKSSHESVRIIYDVERDDIPEWNPDPSVNEREDLFYGFTPQQLDRVLSDKYDRQREDEEEYEDYEVEFSGRFPAPPNQQPRRR